MTRRDGSPDLCPHVERSAERSTLLPSPQQRGLRSLLRTSPPRLKLVRPVSAEGSRMGVCSPWAQAVEKTLLPNAAAAGPGSKILKKITFL